MKPILIFCLAILLTLQAYTQNSLSGIINNKETKETLIGASVYFPDLRKGATTDKDGLYRIEDLPPGKFLMEVKFIGYAAEVVKIEISGETKRDFEMEESHTELKEVVITGNSGATEKAVNPIQTIAIDRIALSQSASTNIIDAVSNKPGISQVTTGTSVSKPVIRGLGYNRVVVLQNNIRQEGQQWGDEHGIEIDEYSVDRVEVIKGPGSLMYGSDAMAGVINFLPANPVEAGKITANIMANYHSNNNLFGYSLQNAGNLRGIHWLVQGSGKQVGNYSNRYDGKVFNSGFNELNLNGSLGIAKKWGYSHVNFSTFNQSTGMVEGGRDSTGNFTRPVVVADTMLVEQTLTDNDLNGYALAIPRQVIAHHRISTTSSFIIGRSRFAVTLGAQQNHRREFGFLGHKYGNNIHFEEANTLYFLLHTLNYDATYFLPELSGWETSIGVNGMQQTNTNKGEEFLIPDYSLFDVGGFGITRKSFGKLHLSGGMRYTTRVVNARELVLNEDGQPVAAANSTSQVKFSSFKNTFSAYSYSVGTSYSFKENAIGKINISSGFRVPNMAELASNGHHEGSFRYERGNSELQPEKSLQSDAGILFNTRHISFELNGFGNSIKQFIFAQKLNSALGGDSIVIDDGNTLSAFQFVQGNANLYGGEVIIDIHPHPYDWLHFENSFSYVQGIQPNQPDSMKYLPFIPAPKFQSELRAQFAKAGKMFRNFYGSVKSDYFFEQDKIFRAYGTETGTPSYFLLNVGLGTDVIRKNGNMLFSIYLAATNILDAAYQNHLSRLKYAPENPLTGRRGVYNIGRNFTIKVMVPLNWKR